MEPEAPQEQEKSRPESDRQDLLLELNFVPTWARQPAGKNPYAQFEGGDRGEGRRGHRRERPRGERPGGG
ncbi:MAG: hypothetical protein V1873_04840, partial [Verrucomicrobiota bacterium]